MWYIERDDILCHHGRKGQKWGERNGPPYPLNAEGNRNFLYKKAVREAKNAKQVVENCKSFPVGGLTTMTIKSGEKFVSGLMHGHDFDWQEIADYDGDGEMTPAATEFSNKISKIYNHYHDNGEDFAETEDSFNKYLKNNAYGMDQETGLMDLNLLSTKKSGIFGNEYYDYGNGSAFNPDYGADGTTQNCAKVSAMIELLYHGYGVNQAGRQTYPSSSNAAEFWFKDAEQVVYDSPSSAEKYLKSYGPGASGTLGMGRDDGTGHALHWAIGKSGDIRIEDGQCGRFFDSMEDVNQFYGFNGGSVSTYRLDNKEPNWENMASDSVMRGTKVKNRFSDKIVDRW